MYSACSGLLSRFVRDRRGNVAMILAIALPALAAMVGFGIDIHRGANAKASAQDAADAAVLSAASSRERTIEGLERVAATYLTGNLDHRYLNRTVQTEFDRPSDSEFTVTLSGSVDTFFMGMVGIPTMPVKVSATAVRGAADRVELALVLDNTWSMSEQDSSGARKIDALKAASRTLVDQLLVEPDGSVRIAVVPYADYVNVGVENRSRPWISVPADQSTSSPRVCKTNTTRRQCTRGTCTRSVDGVQESYECTLPGTCKDVPSAPYESCSGGGTTTQRWHGCVGSRRQGALRLSDLQPGTPYPGLLAASQNCLTPITPLTDRKPTVTSAIDSLIVNVGSYRPLTHIPSGLIWGVNVLTPGDPYTDGLAHHAGNRDPRKIIVLMTDGANTLRFMSGSGEHKPFSTGGNSGATQLRATDADTKAICDYAKSLKIEVFTVALAVDSGGARDLLQNCATSEGHYFDARDNEALSEAFAAIAASVSRVRLVR